MAKEIDYDIPLRKISLPKYNEVEKYLKKIDSNKILVERPVSLK